MGRKIQIRLKGADKLKKIVVITGSPRKNGNSIAMTEAFIQTAEAGGHTVTRFDAAHMDIGGCRGCETCFQTSRACSYNDDFNIIVPAIIEANVVVFTMPVYWYSFPSQIKSVIDKMYSLVVGDKNVIGKECALIACCEEDDRSAFDGIRTPFERTAAFLKWKILDEVIVTGVYREGDIHKTDGCQKAIALAKLI